MAGQQNLGLFIGVRVPVREFIGNHRFPHRTTPLIAFGRKRRFAFIAAPLAVLPLTLTGTGTQNLAPVPLPTASPSPQGFVTGERTVRKLADGVEWIQEITAASEPGGPLVVNVVRISPAAAKHDTLHTALGYGHVWENNATQGRETVSGIAARTNALVAVNASFFTYTSGHPLGIAVENGEPITEPLLSRTAFYTDSDGKGGVTAFDGAGTLTSATGTTQTIQGFNRKPGKGNELLVFTPRFYTATLPSPDRVEVVLSGVKTVRFGEKITGTVSQVTRGGGTLLGPQTVVLSGGGAAGQFLLDNASPGIKWTFQYDVTPHLGAIRQAVAGGPRVVREGKIALNHRAEGFDNAFSTTRHARTAVGVTKDGSILLVTVDGRQPVLSRGASLTELAQLLLKYGAVDGVNMDGGGSTALAIRGVVVNSFCDPAERPVADALVLAADKPLPKSRLPVEALIPTLPGNLTIGATRSFGLPPDVDKQLASMATWSVTNGVGFVSQTGRFIALRAGTGNITALLSNGRRFMVPVTVVALIPPGPSILPSP